MPTNPSNIQAAQLKKLYEDRAKLNKMISMLEGNSSNENPVVPNHTVQLLGFTDFKKPGPKESFNVQAELRNIAVSQGVDTRLSINNQRTQQSIADTVTQMIISQPKIQQKISDPDCFTPASRSNKNENKDTGREMTEPGETKNQATAPATVNSSSSSNQKLRRPKEKQASRVVDEDEDTEPPVQATASSNVKSQEQIIPNNAEVNLDSTANRGGPPQHPGAQLVIPAKSPFAPQEDDMDLDEGEDCKITTWKKNKATASCKRKARDDDAVSEVEIPAPKKGKGETVAALKTLARTKLIKISKRHYPPPHYTLRVLPKPKHFPPVMSKAEIRKAATNKAAATRAANKKAKEDQDKVKGHNKSNARKGKK
ncbi:hypothetical protein RhiXN_01388 [Rhizoctonia solani]|uniref:Uncharacterized protein n=1 Tax=Rhizoctonia solani TaxID=456999 RepID=A0A8H8P8L5_9AGAM|nr:uncharacterized protein RhiXN_01388 [Rhizoctonia solani]QRW26793.1 hypothetical protein RhiXN_01388 [Rhizoctonia solani]